MLEAEGSDEHHADRDGDATGDWMPASKFVGTKNPSTNPRLRQVAVTNVHPMIGSPSIAGGRMLLPPLVAELNRRRVFRALVGYGVVAFAVLQVVEPVSHGLRW